MRIMDERRDDARFLYRGFDSTIGDTMMRRLGTIAVMVMLVATMTTAGYAQTGGMTADQMKMMNDHIKTMNERMKKTSGHQMKDKK